MSIKNFISLSPGQTKTLAGKIAREILKQKARKRAVVIGLIGDLGSGKTTFTQGLAKNLGIKEKITSPTFVILKKFKITEFRYLDISKYRNFFHIDCYRIKNSKDIRSWL